MWNVICGPRFLIFSLFIVVIFIVDTKRLEEFRSNFSIGEQISLWKSSIQDVDDGSLSPPKTDSQHSTTQSSPIDENQLFQQPQFQAVQSQQDREPISPPHHENRVLLPTSPPIFNRNFSGNESSIQSNSTDENNSSLFQDVNQSMIYSDQEETIIPVGDEKLQEEGDENLQQETDAYLLGGNAELGNEIKTNLLEGDEELHEGLGDFLLEDNEDHLGNGNKTKTVAIVSLMTSKFKGTYMAHWILIQSYCQRHNYTCMRFTGMEDKYKDSPYIEALGLPKHWRKLIGVYAALKKFDLVLFLDVDNFILKPNLRIEDLFGDERTSLVFSGNPCFSSSHFFGLRRGPLAFDFLDTWWQFRVFFRDNCHYDQGSFIMAMIALTSRYLHSQKNILHINDDLYQCAAFAYGTREYTLKTMCSSFQRCLEDTCKKWIIPMRTPTDQDPPSDETERIANARIWLEENLESDFRNAGEKVENLPISWNTITWRRQGWDKRIDLSLQGTRNTVFTDCSKTFSVHPVKSLEQVACEITEPQL